MAVLFFAEISVMNNISCHAQKSENNYKMTTRLSIFPVARAFIGARYNKTSGKWLWSDGSTANYESSGLNSCKQKAFHYNNDWELINVDCTDAEAYYICEAKRKIAE